MLGMTSIGLAARKISPAVCFAKPLPAMPGIKRGAVPAQQFHLTAAYAIVHGASPWTGLPLRYAHRCDCLIKSARAGIMFLEEATVNLTDVLPGCAPSELLAAWNMR
jgi:hypothetical protein